MPAEVQTLHSKPGSKFEDVCVGDAVGFVDGPGVLPIDNVGVVLGFGEDRWGEYMVVQRPDHTIDKIMSLTKVGIGIYHLATYLIERQRRIDEARGKAA